MDVPARRPSPYSLQPSEPPARSTSPELKSVPPRERLSPPIGESSLFIPGSGARGYALPRDGSSVQPPQQNSAMSFTPAASRYELEIRKKVPESSYASQLNMIGDRDPPPYSERFSNDAPVGHDVVELHEADQFFGISQPPQAIQTMVKMVTMLNFMKVELGDQKTLRDKEQWRAAAAEFLGTMMFVYLGCGSVVASGMISPNMTCARLVAIALAHGLAICFLAGATGAISGGHLNPAVTLAFVVAGKETLIRAGLYVGAQLFGAVIGAWLIECSTEEPMQRGLGSHDLARHVSSGQGCLVELMLTFILVFVIFGVAVDRRGPGVIAPIPIGFVVLVDHLVGVPYTGASMNPARTFGPALVSGFWGRAPLVYWFGPCCGAVLASAIYRCEVCGSNVGTLKWRPHMLENAGFETELSKPR